MRLVGPALRLTIFVDADDIWHHKPLYHEIAHRAHKAGLAGCDRAARCGRVGAGSLIHTTRILSLAEDLPAVIITVDSDERIRNFLDEVEVIRYVGKDHGG